MEPIDTLIHAGWVIPVEPEPATVYERHSVAVRDGRIVAIVPREEAEKRFTADRVHERPGHALIPGLVNAHTHSPMSLMRGLADDLPLMDWLTQHIWPAEQKLMGPELVHEGTLLAAAEMLRGGITCFNDMYFFPEVTARAASASGLRAVVGLIFVDFPTPWAQNADEYLDKGLAVHDEYRDDPLVRTAFAPHAPYTVSDDPLKRIRVYADELDIPIHMHVHETAHEVNSAEVRPIARLEQLGLLSPHLVAVHVTQITEPEIEQLTSRGVHVVHCPESNLKLASGLCPVEKLRHAGINVALGTDGAASNNDLDMFGEMRTAALLAKAVADDAGALPASQVLQMATLNGARALGMDADIGSLLPGKAADIVAVRLDELETRPLYHPVSQLVYATGRDKVTDVWVDGRHLLNERALTTIDAAAVLEAAEQWKEQIQEYG